MPRTLFLTPKRKHAFTQYLPCVILFLAYGHFKIITYSGRLMKILTTKLFCALSFTAVLISGMNIASAAESSSVSIRAIRAALVERDVAISDLASDDIRFVTQDAMNTVVAKALSALHSEGFVDLARKNSVEWTREYSDFLLRRKLFDLGDHRPLLQFLVRFNSTLEATIGKKAAHQGILGDIYDVNYAIPVTFTPRGTGRTNSTARDRIEYRKHFVPLTNVVIYWSSRVACEKVMRSNDQGAEAKKLCGFVADKLRVASNLYIGPKLSNYVFQKANGLEAQLEITNRDLIHTEAESLLREFSRQ